MWGSGECDAWVQSRRKAQKPKYYIYYGRLECRDLRGAFGPGREQHGVLGTPPRVLGSPPGLVGVRVGVQWYGGSRVHTQGPRVHSQGSRDPTQGSWDPSRNSAAPVG